MRFTDFTNFSILGALLLYIIGTTFADQCYGDGPKFTEITDAGTIDEAITDFCHMKRGIFEQNEHVCKRNGICFETLLYKRNPLTVNDM